VLLRLLLLGDLLNQPLNGPRIHLPETLPAHHSNLNVPSSRLHHLQQGLDCQPDTGVLGPDLRLLLRLLLLLLLLVSAAAPALIVLLLIILILLGQIVLLQEVSDTLVPSPNRVGRPFAVDARRSRLKQPRSPIQIEASNQIAD